MNCYRLLWDKFNNEAIYVDDRDVIAPPERYIELRAYDSTLPDNKEYINHYKKDGLRLDFTFDPSDPMVYLKHEKYLQDNGFSDYDLYAQTIPLSRFENTVKKFNLDINKCII